MALFFNRHQLYQTPGADYGFAPWSFYWWGGVCIPLLPINYLPDISPIRIGVNAAYTGADVETVENTVTTILERDITGVEGMGLHDFPELCRGQQHFGLFPSQCQQRH